MESNRAPGIPIRRTVIAAVVLLLVPAGCSADPAASTSTAAAAPTVSVSTTAGVTTTTAAVAADSWPTSTPEEQGMSSATLAGLFDEVIDEGYGIDTVTIVRNGYVVADAAVDAYAGDSLHIVHSVTKSIVSTLIGIAIDEGYLDGVDQRVLGVFDDRTVANVDARKEQMTIEHLLTMTTGLDCRDSYLHGWEGLHELRRSDDWVQHVLDLPMIAEPGTVFEYCNSGSFLLSAIISEVTGRSAEDFGREHLFEPIGITDLRWPANPDGISIGWGELLIAPRDLARFGSLVLNDGRWEGEQIVPEEWLTRATQPHVEGTLQATYGYQWWIRSDGVVEGLGYAGQYLIIDRERDLVTVLTSDLPDDEFFVPDDLYDRFVIPAVVSDGPQPADSEGDEALRTAVERWSGA